MTDAVQLLDESLHGKQASTNRLVELLSEQLREMAQRHLRSERADHNPTADRPSERGVS